MENKVEKLRLIILDNIGEMEHNGDGCSFEVENPFELSSRDFIRIAEQEIENGTPLGLVNSVSNLKRALDCEIDSFFHTFNLLPIFQKRGLNFGKKLDFLASIGIINTRSLSRFNTIRNKLEHHYEIPKIDDIEAYFDLVTVLTNILELYSIIIPSDISFGTYKGAQKGRWGQLLNIEYVRNDRSIKVEWISNISQDERETLVATASHDINEFAFFFKTYILMTRFKFKENFKLHIRNELKNSVD